MVEKRISETPETPTSETEKPSYLEPETETFLPPSTETPTGVAEVAEKLLKRVLSQLLGFTRMSGLGLKPSSLIGVRRLKTR
jgi:hypothetical protein